MVQRDSIRKMLNHSILVLQSLLLASSLSYSASQTDNIFAPEFVSSTVNERIPETIKYGVVIANVTAIDRDNEFPNNDIRFSLFASLPASEYFGMDSLTGSIYVKKDLTLDTASMYQMYIQAYDMGSPSKTSTMNATVRIDVYRNLRSPVFTGEPYVTKIQENTTTGTTILSIQYRDDDSDAPFNTVTISAIGDDKALTYFRLESNGQIVVNSDLKADSDTQYLMRISARDGGSPPRTATAIATITVQRNINSPVFEAQFYHVIILETTQLGLPLLQLKATDNDIRAPYNEIRYFISSDVGSALGAQYFMVDEITGNISLRQSPMLDNARTVDYTINVNVQDGGVPSLSASTAVTVRVIRNTAPFFPAPKSTTITITNTQNIGTVVTTYTATDNDGRPEFNQVTYSMVTDSTGNSLFRLDSNSGQITLINSLTADDAPQYVLTITARDNGGLTDTGTVTVSINRNIFDPELDKNCSSYLSPNDTCDSNRHSPEFSAPIYFVNIQEGNYSAGHINLTEVLATDEDEYPNNEIFFDIQSVSYNGGGKFSLMPSSQMGKVSIVCNGYVGGGEHYVIILRASNQNIRNSRTRSNSVPIEIKVVSLKSR
uniref:Cadherin EGF LAG seven-pass G-type receptor 3-like n=1 Tax=Crassostrea virginica TaxID=6565 RepID=A0A8B8CF07_CRAVI|nr:cadherin EGF LAG seven-pass G-type receptor 3-like [Crassostrea virginica]